MNGKKLRNSAVAAISVVGLMVGLAACSSGDSDSSSTGGVEDSGIKDTYTVATDSSFVPFEFEEDGEYVGFDIDIINAIADQVGFEVDLKVGNFDGIIPGLQTGTFDIAIAGISITDERKEKIDYTSPYYKSGSYIAVAEGNTEIKSLDDLAGKKVACRLGSAQLDFLAENAPEAEVLPFEQLDQAYLAVEGGTADAVFYDAPNVEYYVSSGGKGKLKLVGDLYQANNYGIAVAKGNDELVGQMNDALASMMEDGSYAEIYKKWFGKEPEWLDELAGEAD